MGYTHYLSYNSGFLTQHHHEIISDVANFLCDAWRMGLINENTFEKEQTISSFRSFLEKGDPHGLADAFCKEGKNCCWQLFVPTGCESFKLDPEKNFSFCKTYQNNINAQDDLVSALCFLIKKIGKKNVIYNADGYPKDLFGGALMYMQIKGESPIFDDTEPRITAELSSELQHFVASSGLSMKKKKVRKQP